MKIRHLLLVMSLLLFAVGVTACTRSASTPPPPTATVSGDFPVPGTQTMGEFGEVFQTIATQTALAAEAGGGVPQDTPVPPGTAPEVTVVETPSPQPEPAQPSQPTEQTVVQQPAAPQAPAFVPPDVPTTYTLMKGEYPYCIARRFNVNPSDLLSLNGLSVNSVIQPGRQLSIPQTGRSFPGERALRSHPTTYTVKTNDTIYSIACQYGDVYPEAIAQANGIESPYNLTVGQTLQVP